MSERPPAGITGLAILLVLATALAGCGKPDAAPLSPVEAAIASVPGKVLHGRVLTDEVVPLSDAVVELLDGPGNITTDAQGGYLFAGLESRDYLVKVSYPGYYPEVQRAAMMLGRDFELDFFLVKMPVGEPRHVTQVFNAFLSCQVIVAIDFPGWIRQDCVAADPNNKRTVTFPFDIYSSGFIIELDWEPTTACANSLDFGAYVLMDNAPSFPVDERFASPGEKIHIPPSYFAPRWADGGEIRMNLAGDYCKALGGGPGLGPGVVLQQPVDIHFTAFYFEDIPADFSIKNA